MSSLKIRIYKFLRQRPAGNYIADFYYPALKIVIEVDGDSHFSDEAAGNDSVRTAYFEGPGIHVIRINNTDVYNNFKEVCMTINISIASFNKVG